MSEKTQQSAQGHALDVLLQKQYARRFDEDKNYRDKLWKVLCNNFFQKYITNNDVVLDIGAGYGEFINNIHCAKKYVVDLNVSVREMVNNDVTVFLTPSTNLSEVPAQSIDVVFVSNFFEHIGKDAIMHTLSEIGRVLRHGKSLLILQPNIRYAYKEYWQFYDHITPLDHESMSEALELSGFIIETCTPQFLPYSTKSTYPRSLSLVKIYLRFPFLWKLFGKQMFIHAVWK